LRERERDLGDDGSSNEEGDSDEEREKEKRRAAFGAQRVDESSLGDDEDERRVDPEGFMSRRRKQGVATLHRVGHPARLARRFPREPAARLSIDSMSAYAPFQGLPIQWMSEVYDDAAT
jgi:hypothetical protein